MHCQVQNNTRICIMEWIRELFPFGMPGNISFWVVAVTAQEIKHVGVRMRNLLKRRQSSFLTVRSRRDGLHKIV